MLSDCIRLLWIFNYNLPFLSQEISKKLIEYICGSISTDFQPKRNHGDPYGSFWALMGPSWDLEGLQTLGLAILGFFWSKNNSFNMVW